MRRRVKEQGPSATAYLVAYHVHRVACEPALAASVDAQSARWGAEFLASSRFWRLAGALARWSPSRAILRRLESLYVPGLGLHQALRKREIEKLARASLATGARQLVVLGAGFDSLAPRLCVEFPEVAFWELDHPNTQAVKRPIVERRLAARSNLRFLGVDLTADDPWSSLRADPRFRPALATTIVCEGVLMYLEESQVRRVFQEAPDSGPTHFAFTFLASDARGRPGFERSSRWVDAWLRRRREFFRWGLSPERLDAFIASLDWTLEQCAGAQELRSRHLGTGASTFPNAAGEYVACARRERRGPAPGGHPADL